MLENATNYLSELTGLGANAIHITMLSVSIAFVAAMAILVISATKKNKRKRYR